jgi:hypothetical protein
MAICAKKNADEALFNRQRSNGCCIGAEPGPVLAIELDDAPVMLGRFDGWQLERRNQSVTDAALRSSRSPAVDSEGD